MNIHNLLSRLFKLEEINGHGACPTYLFRWTLFRFNDRAVYLHRFVGNDWSRDFHDHPKKFTSIGLSGHYYESTPYYDYSCGTYGRESARFDKVKLFAAPWIRSFPAEHKHRLEIDPGQECWTLCITGGKVRDWGFWPSGKWVPWLTYVNDAGLVASGKACS